MDTRYAKVLQLVRIIGVLAVVIAVFRLAWVSDDALITLRTALNITHNWGPGYNATEAVQAYTHPLWFLIWVGIGSATNQWILGILLTSIVFTAIAVALILWRAQSIARVILITGFLLFSNAFVEYATSGLENPLAFAALALVGVLALQLTPTAHWTWGVWFGLAVAAVVLTRFDLALLILPTVLVALWLSRRNVKTIAIGAVAALAPLVIWFTWSQVTYSNWLPNTFEAKRNVNIPASELIIQGLRYLMVSFENDPVTLVGLIVGVGAGIALGNAVIRAGAIGVLLYLAYVVWIGGDFMAGRFLTAPLVVAMLLLAAVPLFARELSLIPAIGSVFFVGMMVLFAYLSGNTPVSLANPSSERWEVDQNLNAGVSDERGVYVANGRDLKGLIDNLSLGFVEPPIGAFGDGTDLNRPLRELDQSAKLWPTSDGFFTLPSETHDMCGFLGTAGIVVGPTVHLVDACALTDRYLAQREYTPAEPFAWKPGHFQRAIPEGYLEAIQSGDPTKVVDPADRFALEQLWANIR